MPCKRFNELPDWILVSGGYDAIAKNVQSGLLMERAWRNSRMQSLPDANRWAPVPRGEIHSVRIRYRDF